MVGSQSRQTQLSRFVVSAEQMRQIEERIFAAQMPVAALMEKVAQLITTRIVTLYPLSDVVRVGILVGPGHNGGDALVVARELHLQGYQVSLYRPLKKLKDLSAAHASYATSLGIPVTQEIKALEKCELIIDGLFGFGLTRKIEGEIAAALEEINRWRKPVISIDLPSGINTDTGEVQGIAIRATYTFCLGLWKLAFLQDQALEFFGKAQLIDFGIPLKDVEAIMLPQPQIQRLTAEVVSDYLPLPRPLVTHKYQQGHLLLICGSSRYAGGSILTGLGARASGVGMLSIAVPESLKPLLVSQIPDALIIGCPETETGAIAHLPIPQSQLEQFTIIACGPGLTLDAKSVVERAIQAPVPLILDADGLNILSLMGTTKTLASRKSATVLTPHLGEFKRLFPQIEQPHHDRIKAAQQAAQESRAIVLFKGSRSTIADADGSVWLLAESTPALARGGSGDVLTGLMGGLMAQSHSREQPMLNVIAAAAWCHAQAGILAAQERTELGVDAVTLSKYIVKSLSTLEAKKWNIRQNLQ